MWKSNSSRPGTVWLLVPLTTGISRNEMPLLQGFSVGAAPWWCGKLWAFRLWAFKQKKKWTQLKGFSDICLAWLPHFIGEKEGFCWSWNKQWIRTLNKGLANLPVMLSQVCWWGQNWIPHWNWKFQIQVLTASKILLLPNLQVLWTASFIVIHLISICSTKIHHRNRNRGEELFSLHRADTAGNLETVYPACCGAPHRLPRSAIPPKHLPLILPPLLSLPSAPPLNYIKYRSNSKVLFQCGQEKQRFGRIRRVHVRGFWLMEGGSAGSWVGHWQGVAQNSQQSGTKPLLSATR